jgi:DMSO/TMAO reductase YedYZ molybdopterin-dependent catalytic subunit
MKMTREMLGITLALITVLVACTPQPSTAAMPTGAAMPTSVAESTPLPTETEASSLSSCVLEPVVVPTRPPQTPGYTQLDPDTGLHMTGTAQEIDVESYRLEVRGKVDHPLSLTYDDLRCLPKVETAATLECPGFFVDEATWAGVPIQEVLALAGVQEGATNLNLVSADGYSRLVPISEELVETAFLAYEWEGEPLPILHGFPVRVVLPGVSGGSWIKWLVAIEVK